MGFRLNCKCQARAPKFLLLNVPVTEPAGGVNYSGFEGRKERELGNHQGQTEGFESLGLSLISHDLGQATLPLVYQGN